MDKIVIVGSSGHARVIIDIVEQQGRHQLVGLIDSFRPAGELTMGHEVLGDEQALGALMLTQGVTGAIIGIGDNAVRRRVAHKLAADYPDLRFVTAVHPSASVGRQTKLGAGTVIMAGACINPCCQIGQHCIINTRASLDHDSLVGDFASLAPGAITGGNVHIGAHSAVGIGATILHGRQVGQHTVIGANATVVKDIPDLTVAYGTPARVVRPRKAGERYL